jgi:dihydroorotate dehydrogenase electron transfer subunit
MTTLGEFKRYTFQSIRHLNDTTSWISIKEPILADPGQFVMVWLPGVGEKPFSIAAMDLFGLMIVDVGPFSHAMGMLKPGDQVWIKGPLGHGFIVEGERILLVGGGYGSAPLLALATAAQSKVEGIDVCLGAADSSKLLLLESFALLECGVYTTTEDGSHGDRGLVTDKVKNLISERKYNTLYACGPTGMLSALAALCRDKKLDYQLSWEAHMRCGMGLCGSCEVPRAYDPSLPVGWLACFDGPVFCKHWE